jgi:hypothetical protein
MRVKPSLTDCGPQVAPDGLFIARCGYNESQPEHHPGKTRSNRDPRTSERSSVLKDYRNRADSAPGRTTSFFRAPTMIF